MRNLEARRGAGAAAGRPGTANQHGLKRQKVLTVAKFVLCGAIPLSGTLLSGYGLVGAAGITTAVLAIICCSLSVVMARLENSARRFSLIIDTVVFLVIAIASLVFVAMLNSPEDTKLYRLNFPRYLGELDFVPSFVVLLWAYSSSALLSPIMPAASRPSPTPEIRQYFTPRAATVMAGMGAIGFLFAFSKSRMQEFSTRGEASGNGLESLLYWAGAAFVAYVILHWRKGDQRFFVACAVFYVIALFLTGNRSPLALVAVSFLLRAISSTNRKTVTAIAASFPALLLTFSYQSTWRSMVSRGLPAGPSDVLHTIFLDPMRSFLGLGLDTIDGHVLSRYVVSTGYDAQWADPLVALLNFIPRQIWLDKPDLLGSQIGREYLGLSAGGIFLSGPGYLSLVSGSVIGGVILFVAMVYALKLLVCMRHIDKLIVCAAIYLVARFSVAGDAFDIFLSIQVVVVFVLARIFGRVIPWLK
ncbi:hypothetical protein [Crystallibacter crystallopoietes]|uniref:hypothetical protein n=1 Tax=Crystallibacter crystallopoietes TaxID=37928 RepID=UPI0002D823F9|nr:hypothetical protein [Arthrobacter crystallopoietes]